LLEPADVVDVLDAFAERFEDDGKRAVLGRDLQQLRRSLPLLPQWRAAARIATGQQERAGSTLSKPRREQGRPADLGGDELVHLVGFEHDERRVRHGVLGVWDAQHDAVVGMRGLRVDAVPLAQPCPDGERPRGVDASAVRRVDDEPPVAELVPEPFDDDRPVVGHVTGRRALLVDIGQEVVGGPFIEAGAGGPLASLRRGHGAKLADEDADGFSQLRWAPERVTVPERQAAGLAGSGRDENPIVRDVLDAPTGGAQ
jgi:hypothetical protein